MVTLLSLLLAGAVPDAPLHFTCLLAGPSGALVPMRVTAAQAGYELAGLSGHVWPFAEAAIGLARESPNGGWFTGRDASGHSVALHTAFGGITLWVGRGDAEARSLPVLAGSCVSEGSAAAERFLQRAGDVNVPKPSIEAFRGRRLRASRHCQVVSAAGWTSRFSIDFHEDGRSMTISPADRNIWSGGSFQARRLGLPHPSSAEWLRLAFAIVGEDRPAPNDSIDSIWVYANPDRTSSSARVSFFGHDVEGATGEEDLTGLCTDFVEEGRPQ